MFFLLFESSPSAMIDAVDKHIDGIQAQIEAVKQQIQSLQDQLDALNTQIVAANSAKMQWQLAAVKEGPQSMSGGASREPDTIRDGDALRRRETNEAKVLRLAKEVLSTADIPLDRHDLLIELRRRGFSTSVVDPAKFIGKALWKSPDFVHHKRDGYWSGYWLKARPLPVVE
jgi:uncharacterized protein YoxC